MKWHVTEASEINNDIIYGREINIGAGFGPTGIPHIGTLCEIIRTNLVKKELSKLGRNVNFYLISDDLDPFRKIPSNIPNPERLIDYLGMPINKVPDPFGVYSSFSEMAEMRLLELTEEYGIECNIIKNSLAYEKGDYNESIKLFLKNFSTINQICKDSTGFLRQRTYNIIMPISEITGKVLEHIVITDVDPNKGEISYYIPSDEIVNKPGYEYGVELKELYCGEIFDQEKKISVLNGKSKLQWKADWSMRLLHRNIHFEMHGEDLTDSAKVVNQIFRALNQPAPRLYRYGLFLDSSGKKISKSKGNGFSLNDAKNLLTQDAIQIYLSKDPKKASKFYIEQSPRLNDQVNISKNNKKRLSFLKISRILKAAKPASLTSAMKFLDLYRRDGEVISEEELKISYNYYFKTNKNNNLGLVSVEEEQYFSAVASFMEKGKCFYKEEVFNFILNTFKDHFPERETAKVWNLLYRGLFGDKCGPRIETWLELNDSKDIINFFNNPHKQKEINKPQESENVKKEFSIVKEIDINQGLHMTKLFGKIDFNQVKQKCSELSCELKKRSSGLIDALSGYQCKIVTEDEILRSVDLLENIGKNEQYFQQKIYGITSFLPLNQPIYASVCFGFIPSLMAENVCIRPPTAMHTHYKKFENVIELSKISESLSISYEDKELFLSQRVKITDAVIFTGTPENAVKVRKHFRKNTLFILNGAGHNPLVVSKDASIDLAIESAKRVVLYNQGQDCAGPNSILVHNDVYDSFRDKLISSLKEIEGKVGSYSDYDNIVGPNSDIDHSIKIADLFKINRSYCTYGGEINPIDGMIKPTVFEKPVSLGGNYKEFFAPVFFLQKYYSDQELADYFTHPSYSANAMYISLFGTSDYISYQLNKKLHLPDSILHDTDLHLEEHGYLPYGGQGPAASCLWYDGVRINGSTLPQRDIYQYLVEPHNG
ncbi:aldehyde dehydrogenase family protein [Xenorhabdus innexi]|uniref:Bifunctional proline dehydrogenase/pyrroline-5-carboxylate dehydrogenase n=1 Tax=Xenorhabdus innexi TaxID=290109 RepID=A0A1N6N1F2_9GAMM|nr:aldehyde dehydrogenase family protein [Xenorhabdus innexi]PHM36954.1 bifunctional proline dehydrogenase/pyrroline-5-carboxylate dehydrogenase [Xenorhabdus innexi]SIP74864.1 Similarities with lysine-tRNA ligase LysS [Xenorhabdus innexi]